MPILGDLYPLPQDAGDVLDAWHELSSRVLSNLTQVDHGVERARSGGDQVANQTQGIESAGNQALEVLGSSKPSGIAAAAAGAGGNAIGVSQDMGRAVGKAIDPNTDPGPVDFDSANRAADAGAGGINSGANQLRGYPEPPEPGGGGHEPV